MCHRGRVVYAITYHRDARLFAELFDHRNFVVGHQVAPGFVETDFFIDGIGNLLIVTREHEHAIYAPLSYSCNHVLGGGTRREHGPAKPNRCRPLRVISRVMPPMEESD